jgi:hypothetical protein
MTSFLACCENERSQKVAAELDSKVESLLKAAAA